MNFDFLKKIVIGLAESAAKDGLVKLIEQAEVGHPALVQALEKAIADLIPVLKELAAATDTPIDDEVVKFLDEVEKELEKQKA